MKNDARTFHVAQADVGQTLASALKRWLDGPSWNEIRKAITGRRVQVNGNLCLDDGRRLKQDEVVKLHPHALAAPPKTDDVRIRYLDAQVVVVEKPAGMTTLRHSEERFWPDRRKQRQPTLDEVIPQLIARQIAAGKSKSKRRAVNDKSDAAAKSRLPRIRAVHRLDRDTSGLMIFARTAIAERSLVEQFRKHTVRRAYLAICKGDVTPRTIETRLVRDRGDGRRGSSELPNAGKRAVTHVRPIERINGYTIVECRLETGRTHQIRIHMSELGHPVCGDKVYFQPLFKKSVPDRSGAPRLALHAAELGFLHPVTGESLAFRMPLPDDLAQFVQRLRARAAE